MLLLPVLLLTGCSDSNPVDADARVEEPNTSLRLLNLVQTVHGEITGTYAEDVGESMRPSRRVEATMTFRVRALSSTAREGIARGTLTYSDNLDERFKATILYARFDQNGTATFWGPVDAPSMDAPTREQEWIFVRVRDGRAAGTGEDQLVFQIGPPMPHPNTNLPDEDGTIVNLEAGNIVISNSKGLRVARVDRPVSSE